jgi:integrase/recombinase XerC
MKSELNRFLRYLQIEKGASVGTVEGYQLDIERGLLPFLHERGKSRVREITKADIRDYLDYAATSRGNSNITRARKLAAIKSFFNYLVDNGVLEVNPAASVKSPKIPEKEPVYLNDGELTRLLTAIVRKAKPRVRERDMAIVLLFLHGGMRVSELTKLELANVELES